MSRPMTELITIAKQNHLAGAEILDQFSLPDIATIYNGIGPDRFPDWLRAIVTEANGLFEPAALIHDIEYHIGGTKENFTAANDRFRENCYTLVNAAYSWYDPRRYKWLFRAWRYAGYCQEFGWSGFHKIGAEREPVGREQVEREPVDLVDKVDGVDDVDGAEGEVMADCRGDGAECKVMADCRRESTEGEAEKCAGCENCTCGKHEAKTAAEPAVKPKSHKKTRKGKKK